MIPGLVTKVSEEVIALATTISPKSDLVHVTSTVATTVVATIVPPYQGFSGILFLANRSGGNITSTTSGNILSVFTSVDNQILPLIYSKLTGKWMQASDAP
jgi:hypothetical protein